ncbi:MAG: hypothetical protein WBB01_23300 [Phormidesmis sp.]
MAKRAQIAELSWYVTPWKTDWSQLDAAPDALIAALKSAQFVTDAQGQQVAIQIKPAVWKALVTWLETANGGPAVEEIIQAPAVGGNEDALLVTSAAKLSEPSLATVWDNSEDDIYNDL